MCKCGARIVVTSHSRICTECGREVRYVSPQIQAYQDSPRCSIVATPYSRKQRFLQLLRKVLGVDAGPPVNDKVWRVLAASAPYKTSNDIVLCLKNSTLKSKHYTSLHAFSKLHLTNYTPPNCHLHTHAIESQLGVLFSEIEFLWYRYQSTSSFFSYAWLLEKLLRHIGVFRDYKMYLKMLVCPNRRAKYEKRWGLITTFLPTNSRLSQHDRQQGLLETALKCYA